MKQNKCLINFLQLNHYPPYCQGELTSITIRIGPASNSITA